MEFALPGAPPETTDVKVRGHNVLLSAPARDIQYGASVALSWPVKPAKAQATCTNGRLRLEVPFKDPMEDAVKVLVEAGVAELQAAPGTGAPLMP
jgi:HSP20 family protein